MQELSRQTLEKKNPGAHSTVDDRLRRSMLLSCPLCKPNRGENAKRRPPDDRGKTHRRRNISRCGMSAKNQDLHHCNESNEYTETNQAELSTISGI